MTFIQLAYFMSPSEKFNRQVEDLKNQGYSPDQVTNQATQDFNKQREKAEKLQREKIEEERRKREQDNKKKRHS